MFSGGRLAQNSLTFTPPKDADVFDDDFLENQRNTRDQMISDNISREFLDQEEDEKTCEELAEAKKQRESGDYIFKKVSREDIDANDNLTRHDSSSSTGLDFQDIRQTATKCLDFAVGSSSGLRTRKRADSRSEEKMSCM